MTVLCTFNSTTVPSRAVKNMKKIGSYYFEVELECATKSFSQYEALAAIAGHIGVRILASGKTRIQTLGGTKASLVLNGTTYTNCYIKDISAAEADGMQFDLWIFSITFIQETI